jgi:acyl carrier protein
MPSQDQECTFPDASTIQAWLVAKLSEELEIDAGEIDVREPFTSYGMSSVLAVSLSGDLEDWLDRPLAPTLAFDFPSIETLSLYLAGLSKGPAPGIPGGNGSRLRPEPGNGKPSRPQPIDSQSAQDLLAKIDELSDEEVERLLENLEADPPPHP